MLHHVTSCYIMLHHVTSIYYILLVLSLVSVIVVVSNVHLHLLGKTIPTDYIIFFKGVETTNQSQIFSYYIEIDTPE